MEAPAAAAAIGKKDLIVSAMASESREGGRKLLVEPLSKVKALLSGSNGFLPELPEGGRGS